MFLVLTGCDLKRVPRLTPLAGYNHNVTKRDTFTTGIAPLDSLAKFVHKIIWLQNIDLSALT